MDKLFNSQFNLNIKFPEDIAWLIYQFVRESNSDKISFIFERFIIRTAFLVVKIPNYKSNEIMQTNPRLNELVNCAKLSYIIDLDNTNVPNYSLLYEWSKLEFGSRIKMRHCLEMICNGSYLPRLNSIIKWRSDLNKYVTFNYDFYDLYDI
jgi:hypothetical protein